jgi:Flp pilus assembly protein TadG
MTISRKRPRPFRNWRSWRDDGGVAAVEFALILPVALLIMGLIVYGGQTFNVQRNVTLSAMTVANLVAQGNNNSAATITAAEINQILSYPNLILYPNNSSLVQVVVSELSVTYNSTTKTATATVKASCANSNGTARPIGQQMSLDPDIWQAFTGGGTAPASAYVIYGEVAYPFQPYGVSYAVPLVTLHDSIMMIPRTNLQITLPDPPCNATGL